MFGDWIAHFPEGAWFFESLQLNTLPPVDMDPDRGSL